HGSTPRDIETAALLRRIEIGVQVYEREFRAFLNGQASRPPGELEMALQAAFDELAQHPRRRCDLGFRLDALEARFHASSRLLAQRMARAERCPTLRLQHAS